MCPTNYLKMLYQKQIEVKTDMLNGHPFWPTKREISYLLITSFSLLLLCGGLIYEWIFVHMVLYVQNECCNDV